MKRLIEKMDARILFGLFILCNFAVILTSYAFIRWMVSLG